MTGFDNVDDLVVNNAAGVTFSGASFSGGPSQYTVNILNVAGDGEISLAVDTSSSVTDLAGNPLGSSVTSAAVAIDNTAAAPTITGISTDTGASGDGVTFDNTLELSGTAEAGSTVEVFRDSSNIGAATADGTGGWTFDYTGTALADGNYTFTARATDPIGNVSSESSGFQVTVDTTVQAPTSLDLAAADDSGTSDSDNITKNTSNLTISGSGEEGSTVLLYDDGAEISGATATVSGRSFSLDVSLAANQTHALTAIQTDPAGNTSSASAGLDITVDAAVTSISITEPATGSASESLDAVTGSSSDSLAGVSSVELRITDGSQYVAQDQSHVSTPTWVTASGTDSWSFITNLVNWKNDTTLYHHAARATDQAGKHPAIRLTYLDQHHQGYGRAAGFFRRRLVSMRIVWR